MKQLASQFFDDDEYELLIKAKSDRSWKEFILSHQDYLKVMKVK